MKKAIVAFVFGLSLFIGMGGSASAWSFSFNGQGACQPDGSYKIIWTIDNTKEKEALDIKYSSNPSIIPAVDGAVPSKQKRDFTQVVSGTKPDKFSMKISANWQSDQQLRTAERSVKLKKACDQPAPVTPTPTQSEGGRGGVVQSTQVVAPVGAVNAGAGTISSKLASIAGLFGSLSLGAYGLRRLRQSR